MSIWIQNILHKNSVFTNKFLWFDNLLRWKYWGHNLVLLEEGQVSRPPVRFPSCPSGEWNRWFYLGDFFFLFNYFCSDRKSISSLLMIKFTKKHQILSRGKKLKFGNIQTKETLNILSGNMKLRLTRF